MRLYLKNFDYVYEGPYPFGENDWGKLQDFAPHYAGYLVIKNDGQGDEVIAREDFNIIGQVKEQPKVYTKAKKKK